MTVTAAPRFLRRTGLLAGLALAALAAACASDPGGPPPPGPGGGPETAGPPMGPQIFVSPFGEPFRSEPGQPYPVAAWFARADTDSDGRLSSTEFATDGSMWFVTLDANNDGVIGPAEIAAYEAMTAHLFADTTYRAPVQRGDRPRNSDDTDGNWPGGPSGELALAGDQDGGMGGPPGGGRRGGGGGRGPGGGAATSLLAMAGLLNVPEPVKSADVDTNQVITADEWTRAGDRWFQLLDADKDGFLTLAELPHTGLQDGGQHGRGPGGQGGGGRHRHR